MTRRLALCLGLALSGLAALPAQAANTGQTYLGICRTQMAPNLAEAYCQCSFVQIQALPGIQPSLVFDFVDASARGQQFDQAYASALMAQYGLPQAQFQQEFDAAVQQMSAIDGRCMQAAQTGQPPIAQVPPSVPGTPASPPPLTPPASGSGRDQVFAACLDSIAQPPDKQAYCQCAAGQIAGTYSEQDQVLMADIIRLDTELAKTGQAQVQPAQLTAIAFKNQITVEVLAQKLQQMAPNLAQVDATCLAQQGQAAPQTPPVAPPTTLPPTTMPQTPGPQTQMPPAGPYSGAAQQFYTACMSGQAPAADAFCRCQVDKTVQRVTPADLQIVADIMTFDAELRQQGRDDPKPEEVQVVAQKNNLTLEQFVQRINGIQPTLNQIDAECAPLNTGSVTPPPATPATPPPMTPPPVTPPNTTGAPGFSGAQAQFFAACTANPEPTLTDPVCKCTTEQLSQQTTPQELKIVADMLALDTAVRQSGRVEATPEELTQLAQANGLTLEQFAQIVQTLSPRMDAVDRACASAQ